MVYTGGGKGKDGWGLLKCDYVRGPPLAFFIAYLDPQILEAGSLETRVCILLHFGVGGVRYLHERTQTEKWKMFGQR